MKHMSDDRWTVLIHRYPIGAREIVVVGGDMLMLAAEGLVCYSSTSLTLHSALATHLIGHGGMSLRTECAKHAPATLGDAVVLSAGKLEALYLLVAVTNKLRLTPRLEDVRSSLRTTLRRADQLGLHSLALPPLRIRRQLNDEDVLLVTFSALIDHLSGPTSLQQAFVVLEPEAITPGLTQTLGVVLDFLKRLGELRSEVAGMREAIQRLEAIHDPTIRATAERLREWHLDLLRQMLGLLAEGESELPQRWVNGLVIESEACRADIARLEAPHARAVGQVTPAAGSTYLSS